MRLSGINYNIASIMASISIRFVCIVLLCTIVYTKEIGFTRRERRSSGIDLIRMSENLTEIPKSNGTTEFLNLAYNQITYLQDQVFLNNSYRYVKKIYLQRNNIKNISADAFKGLKLLKVLDLSDNNLTTLNPYTFKYNLNLDKLILMNNQIFFDRSQTFIVSHSVETLVLSNNKITEIYGLTFLGVPNLKRLVLTDNELTSLAPFSFKSLRKLHYLSLTNTGVHKLSESMFIKLPRIINLENTPLAKRFEPPLRQVTDESVTALLKINKFVFN